jgi:hypothetical protein
VVSRERRRGEEMNGKLGVAGDSPVFQACEALCRGIGGWRDIDELLAIAASSSAMRRSGSSVRNLASLLRTTCDVNYPLPA